MEGGPFSLSDPQGSGVCLKGYPNMAGVSSRFDIIAI